MGLLPRTGLSEALTLESGLVGSVSVTIHREEGRLSQETIN